MFLITVSLTVLTCAFLLYSYINRKYSYWSSRGVPGPRPLFPFGFTLEKAYTFPFEYELGNVKKYGPVYGVYTGTLPTLTVTDPELIRKVLVKDFASYANRRELHAYNYIWELNMFNLDYIKWRRVRSIVTPAFTTRKLREMYPLMEKCVDRLVKLVDSKADSKTPTGQQFNAKSVISGFSIDIIAASAFATETDANESDQINKNVENSAQNDTSFVSYCNNIFSVSPFKVAAVLVLPRFLLTLLGITVVFSEAPFNFMISFAKKIIQDKKSALLTKLGPSPGKANDLVQMLMENFTTDEQLKESNLHKLTASIEENDEKKSSKVAEVNQSFKKQILLNEDEIVSQCVLFFFAGFETSAFQTTTALFELAQHPDIQEQLFTELKSISEKFVSSNNDEQSKREHTDELLTNAPYLDAVIKEALRKYPNVIRIERRVTAENGATLGGIHLDKEVMVEIPTLAVHHNPDYYPEPEVFRPERFMPENKHLLVPYTFLSFGLGPRNCVGMRFAYQEIKLCLARLIIKFKFSPAHDTPAKLTFEKGAQLLVAEPFHLKVERRQ